MFMATRSMVQCKLPTSEIENITHLSETSDLQPDENADTSKIVHQTPLEETIGHELDADTNTQSGK